MTPILHDVTLRDGNHALRHRLTLGQVTEYCLLANKGPADVIEIGHGNGLGASSYLVGKSLEADAELLSTAKKILSEKKLGVHIIPGFATFARDVKIAIEIGVDVFRVASHVTEANICAPHIEKLASENKAVHGVLMMSHMAPVDQFVIEAKKLVEFGATGVVFMDSAGAYQPDDVRDRVTVLKLALPEDIQVGFHAHNNLGFGLANAIAALSAGADILDGSAAGLGAGAGNVNLELIGAWLHKKQLIELEGLDALVELAEHVETEFPEFLPRISTQSIRSGLAGAFSGYSPQVKMAAKAHSISAQAIWSEIGKRKLVAGQESMIWEIAQDLANL